MDSNPECAEGGGARTRAGTRRSVNRGESRSSVFCVVARAKPTTSAASRAAVSMLTVRAAPVCTSCINCDRTCRTPSDPGSGRDSVLPSTDGSASYLEVLRSVSVWPESMSDGEVQCRLAIKAPVGDQHLSIAAIVVIGRNQRVVPFEPVADCMECFDDLDQVMLY